MFERTITTLGKKSKAILREFTGRKRMSEDAYLIAMESYNTIVATKQKEKKQTKKILNNLPEYVEQNQTELKQIRKQYQEKQKQIKIVNKQKIEDAKYAKSVILDLKVIDRPASTFGYSTRDWFESEILPKLIDACKKVIGKKVVYVQTSIDGSLFKTGIMDIKYKLPLTIYWEDLHWYIERYEDGQLFNIFEQFEDYARVVIFDTNEIPPQRIEQKYLDGVKHCVIEPLKITFSEYAKNSISDASKKKIKQILRRLDEYESKYVDGVPEEDMEIIAKAVSRCIVIHNLIGGEIKRYNTTSTKYYHFTNTRKNHIDKGCLTIGGEYKCITQSEMNDLVEEHDKNRMFYIFDGDVDGKVARSLSSSIGNWKVLNEDYDIFKKFDETIGKKNYGIEAVEYKELNEFIKEARIINATPVPLCENPNDLNHYVHHIDIAKAYTQHRYSEFYNGFLGHIYGYSKLDNIDNALEFIEKHIGIYQVKIIKNKNRLLNQLGIFENQIYTLPSVEIIAFIKKYDVKVKLIAGCWGSSFDFDYSEEMLENRRYAIWAGKLGHDKPYQRFSFTGDREWASHLKYELGNDKVFYFNDLDMITISLDKKQYYTYHHIFAFITSYTRLNMLDIMSKIDGELVKVIMDGIYYRGEVQDVIIPHHKDKELKTHIAFREHWYYPSMIETKKWAKYCDTFIENCVLSGAGGTGKTYSVYNHKGLIKPLYVVPSHILGRKMRDQFNCDYTTIQRLVGDDCMAYKDMFRQPHTILIDELTMINKKYIDKALEMYPTSLILLAGDIDEKQWYQCRNGHDGIFNEIFMPDDWKYVHYDIDRRSKDDKIKKLKQDIRNEMKKIFETGGRAEAEMLNQYIIDNYNVLSFEDAIKQFKIGDIWIAGTHNTNKKLLENNIVSGFINNKKEINNSEGEKRGSFTIHSYQGLTIEKEKVFISLDNFEYAMLYTAISRCCHFDQITFVRF